MRDEQYFLLLIATKQSNFFNRIIQHTVRIRLFNYLVSKGKIMYLERMVSRIVVCFFFIETLNLIVGKEECRAMLDLNYC